MLGPGTCTAPVRYIYEYDEACLETEGSQLSTVKSLTTRWAATCILFNVTFVLCHHKIKVTLKRMHVAAHLVFKLFTVDN